MKTSIDITDALFEQARELAAHEGTTLRALVEEGLRMVLEERAKPRAFKLKDGSFKGESGFQPGMENITFQEMLEMFYGGRGS